MKTNQLNFLLKLALEQLSPISETPRTDAQYLMMSVLSCDLAALMTWPERLLSTSELEHWTALLARRLQGEPIAYILGQREFWSLPLNVTPATLIPRPDTELLVEAVLTTLPHSSRLRLADLGTGSGAIALALASERPAWQIIGVDRSPEVLDVARLNAKRLQLATIEWRISDWFSELGNEPFDAIVSNPPYIAANDPHLQQGDLRFEPHSALIGGQTGMEILTYLIHKCSAFLKPHGYLFLEHGYDQARAVQQSFLDANFIEITTLSDLSGHPRVSIGRRIA